MAKKSKSSDSSATPATVALTKAGVSFVVHHYEPDESATSKGMAVANALGIDPSAVFKTLLANVDGALVVGVVPVDRHLDLKAIAAAAGGRKAVMAEVADAERSTGYVVGGISPVGQRKKLRTFIDERVNDLETVVVSAGRRGMQIEVAPSDLIDATGAAVASISKP